MDFDFSSRKKATNRRIGGIKTCGGREYMGDADGVWVCGLTKW